MDPPRRFDVVGWYTGAPPPGEPGPAVLAGHVDSRSGPAVFFRLRDLTPGDPIEIERGDGTRVTFVVTRTERHPKDAFPTEEVYGGSDVPVLRLITCGGEFDARSRHYRDNVIVFAELP